VTKGWDGEVNSGLKTCDIIFGRPLTLIGFYSASVTSCSSIFMAGFGRHR